MGHSSVEHKLRVDIAKRHSIKKEIEKKQSLIGNLFQKIERTKKKRLNNRYSGTVRRLTKEVGDLKSNLNDMNLELQERIKNEMKFSEREVTILRKQYQEEFDQLEKTEGKLESIEEETAQPEIEQEEEKPAAKEAMIARTKRMLRQERRAINELEREINSEERDKEFFAEELQEIMAEVEIYSKS